jgi:DNA-binding Lrp family transcriptional regulator
VGYDYIPIEEAAQRFGLHANSLKRLLRQGILDGYKANVDGRRRWMVSVVSVRVYTDPVRGYLLNLPGPKLFLSQLRDEGDEGDEAA